MTLPLNQIIQGDCAEVLASLPEKSVDLIFADPPYYLQLQNELHRPDMSKVGAVNDEWDKFNSFAHYDDFTQKWLTACRRVLKPNGSLWVIGSYHNIFRVGNILQNLGFWILNDVIWVKTNPMPNFRGTRFTNAHETLIWASQNAQAEYTFNYHAMKEMNEEKQMRSDWWLLSLATGHERLKDEEGEKVHSTQKPLALLYRVLLAASKPGDVILDPFFGSGTTGVAAKILHRNWIGIELEEKYIQAARQRLAAVIPAELEPKTFEVRSWKSRTPRVSFATLLENNYLQPGQTLYFQQNKQKTATIKPDSRLHLTADNFEGSIHQVGKHLMQDAPCNGWEHWFYQADTKLLCLDELRQQYLKANKLLPE